MRRLICMILAAAVLAGICMTVFAEDDEDDSVIVPVEFDEEFDEETDEGIAEAEENEDDSVIIPVDVEIEPEGEPESEPVRVMQFGDKGDDVAFLQTRLIELKYYRGTASGSYGEATRDAVQRFQGDFGLEATGIADIQTQMVLYTAMYRPLKYGSSGDDVKELQTQLTALGYFKEKIKGNYLESTQRAVEMFQRNNHLQVTGVADPDTQEVLFSGKAVGYYDDATPTPTPIPDLNNYLVDEDENSVPLPDEAAAFTKKLKNGSSGAEVKLMQQRLHDLGYLDASKVSGNFQKYTFRAVKAIQTQNGLKATGVVDEETWNVIFNDAHVVLPDQTPKPTPTPSPVPFYVYVDVRNQIVSVYARDEYGEYTVPVRQMLCSTGKVGTDSDPGDWVMNGRKATWCYFPKWGGYARYWTRINSSIAFHSVIYHSVSTKDMKTSSYRALGSRASHGCIRLTVADAKWIYDNCGEGTVVHITTQNETRSDPELKDSLKLAPLSEKEMVPVKTPEPTPEPVYRSDVKPELNGKVLKKKSSSEAVFWLQNRLKELGYYDTKCTGKMLDRTVSALKAFQRDHGMPVSGTADQKVIDALFEEPTPTPRPTPTPYEP